MYISCSLILVLYFYICISLYFYLYQAGPLNNAASGSQEALRSVRWIGKITLGEGMKSSQKPHEILNTFSAFLSFFFFIPLFIWRVRLAMYKPQGLPLSGCATPVFCFVARLTCFQHRGERRWMSTRQRSKARTPRVSVEWREFGVFFVFLRLGKVFKPLSVHGFVNKLEIIVHSVTLTPQRNVIESSLFPFKRPLRAKCAHVQTSVTIFPT